MSFLLGYQIFMGQESAPKKVIDMSIYDESSIKFGEVKEKKPKVQNGTVLDNIYETLTNKIVVEKQPVVIEVPIKVVKKEVEKPKIPVPEKPKIIEKPKPAPCLDCDFKKQVESQTDRFDSAFSGLTHEMKQAVQKYFPFDIISHPLLDFDDLGLSQQQSISSYLSIIFWIHSKALAAFKGKKMMEFDSLNVQKLKNAGSIPVIASQLTEVTQEGVLPKLSDEQSKILSKKLKQIRADFEKMKVENFSKLENRI